MKSESKSESLKTDLQRNCDDFLTKAVAQAMPGYEPRGPQIRMLDACADIIDSGGVLMAEAGTGTGKTFAYLIPIILSGKKALISTRTINLQEQLVSKDLGFLSSLHKFEYAIAKGRANYLCLRRLFAFQPSDNEELAEIRDVREWEEETDSGDIEDFSLYKRPQIWDRVCSDSDACKGKKCTYTRNCYYFAARKRWEAARILVTNHAMLALNAMMDDEKKMLPESDVLVIDEAHSLDNVVSDQIGINLSDRGMERIFNKLLKVDQRGIYKGILSKTPELFGDVEELKVAAGLFWTKVRNTCESRRIIRGRFSLGNELSELGASISSLLDKIRTANLNLFNEDEELDLKAEVIRLRALREETNIFPGETDGFVRWAESEGSRTALRMSPVYPSKFIRENLMPHYSSAVLTSATLSVSGDFSLTENVLGIAGSTRLALPSPFDISRQVKLEVKKGIDLQQESGPAKLASVITEEAVRETGGTLVLFTSRAAMSRTWELCSDSLREAGLNPMMQGEISNRKMLNTMRESTDSVIFGLDSFWEGVDVKGDSLNCLIITKLPFEVPTEPLVVARTDEIRKSGGNPFRDYSLPRAILKFKQGFGRLIRSHEDKGRVIVCDERIVTKDYGRKFLESIR